MGLTHINPNLLHMKLIGSANKTSPLNQRGYTLTHSDITSELFLTIGKEVNFQRIEAVYTRLTRDKMLAKWELMVPLNTHVMKRGKASPKPALRGRL